MSIRIPAMIKERLEELRRVGWSVPEIAREVGISKTTVHKYVHNIPIGVDYQKYWFGKRGGSRRRKEMLKDKANQQLINDLNSPLREKLLVILSLYWAEGSKKDLNFMNSDPNMIKVFVNLVRSVWSIENARLRMSIRIHNNLQNNKDKILQFWSEWLNIPFSQFGKVEIVEPGKKSSLQYGMCRVRVLKGGYLLKYLEAGRSQLLSL